MPLPKGNGTWEVTHKLLHHKLRLVVSFGMARIESKGYIDPVSFEKYWTLGNKVKEKALYNIEYYHGTQKLETIIINAPWAICQAKTNFLKQGAYKNGIFKFIKTK